MIPRQLETAVSRLAQGFPVITVTGPRQSGKTPLAREMFGNHEYVSLENPDSQQLAAVDPHAFLDLRSGPAIFDEARRIPTLFSYLQETVDRANAPGRYVLTGSQNFLLLKSISQTLAGRVGVTHLLPLSYRGRAISTHSTPCAPSRRIWDLTPSKESRSTAATRPRGPNWDASSACNA